LKRILIANLRSLTDSILAGPCFEAVRQAFPDARITGLFQSPSNELYEKSGWVDEVMVYNVQAMDRNSFWAKAWKNARFVKALQKRFFDLAVDLSGSLPSAELVGPSKALVRMGLGLPAFRPFYDVAAPMDDTRKVPSIERNRRVLKLLQLEPKPHDRSGGYWNIPPDALQYADTFWKANRFTPQDMVLAVNPFAGCESKEWYPAKWAAVIKELSANGLLIFFTCFPLQKNRLSALEKVLGQSLPVYAGSSPVPLLGLYQRCAAVVGVDSAYRHLAAAVGTPTLTIWGPEPLGRRHPYAPGNHPVAMKEVPCRPCRLTVCVDKKHECMVALQPEDVLKSLKQLLKRSVAL